MFTNAPISPTEQRFLSLTDTLPAHIYFDLLRLAHWQATRTYSHSSYELVERLRCLSEERREYVYSVAVALAEALTKGKERNNDDII